MVKSIFITVGLQNDIINSYNTSSTRVAPLGNEESNRILGDNFVDGPLGRVLTWAYKQPEDELFIIHIREWYDDLEGLSLDIQHCIAGSYGAEFIFKELEKNRKASIINTISLNAFMATNLDEILSQFEDDVLNVGIIGVNTDVQIYFLVYELLSRYKNLNLIICSALTASDIKTHHLIALDMLHRILGVEIIHSLPKFLEKLIPGAGEEFHEFKLDESIIEQDEEIKKLDTRASHRLIHTQRVLSDSMRIMDDLTEIALKDDDYTEDETYLLNVISEKMMKYKELIKKILTDDIVSHDEHLKMKEYEREILDIALSTANRDSKITVDEKNILNALHNIFDNFHRLEPLD